MKRFLFLSALASAALASCVNDEAMENTSQASDQKITFNAPVVTGTTRAEYATETPVYGEQGSVVTGSNNETSIEKYSENEEFCVFACWTKDKYSTSAKWDYASDLYMNNVMVKYNSTNSANTWDPETAGNNPYYWPKTGYLTFAAYSPACLKNLYGLTYKNTGLEVDGFTVANDVTKQYDFMYSVRSYNRTASENQLTNQTLGNAPGHTTNSYNGVDILFKHALSSIKFKVKSEEDYKTAGTTIKLTKISILNAYSKGDFDEKIEDGATYAADPVWTSHSDETNYVAWNSDAQELTTTATEPTSISDIILLPQTFDHTTNNDVSVLVEYTIQNGNGPVLAQNATLNLVNGNNRGYYKDGEGNNANEIGAWEMGKRYIYTITIGLDKIYFSPEVVEWVDVNVTPDLTI